MHNNIFFRQLLRSNKSIFYVLLLLAVTAFFVTSVNLYVNTTENLQSVEETYSTLAVVELYGDVDKNGNLVKENSENHVGYKSVAAQGYDIGAILDSDAVKSWDLRVQYGAYIENMPALNGYNQWNYKKETAYTPRANGNLIRFKIKGDTPLTLDLFTDNPQWMELDVLDDAAGCFLYGSAFEFNNYLNNKELAAYAEEIKQVNRNEETTKLTLYPDVEYGLIPHPMKKLI